MKKIGYFLIFLFILSDLALGQHYKKDGTPDRRYKVNKSVPYHHPSVSPRHTVRYSSGYSFTRDSHGKRKRSESAKRKFMKQTGYPKGRHGYVIDHKVPLKKGGCDCPSNMQWQTIDEAKAKDKWE